MRFALFRCLLLVVMSIGFAACVMDPGDGVDTEDLGTTSQEISYNGHDYLFVVTPKTWHQAQTHCGTYGYNLVTINDAAEEAFLDNQEIRFGRSRWWIGYTDQGIEGSWIWASGSSSHINWGFSQPDNASNQDCAVDRFDGFDIWDDQSCAWNNVFICERDSEAPGNRGSFSYSASATNSATTNTHQHPVQLFAGQLLTVGTCGVPGASAFGDTYLRIKNPSGVVIASNDDSCGLSSNISIVIPTTGTYTIHAGCYSSGSCSGTVAYNN